MTGNDNMTLMNNGLGKRANAIGATTAMRVAAELRERILRGELQPGQRLKIDELSALLNVSHMPVREALQDLESEGILEVYPHRGTVIRGVDDRFIRNMYDVRAAIEGMLTERCAENICEDDVAALKRAAMEYEAAVGKKKFDAATQANFKLHGIINGVADNPDAVRVLTQGRLLVEALRYRFGSKERRLAAIVEEHRKLVDAIVAGEVKPAGELARQHCLGARDDILALLAEAKKEQ